MMGLLELLSKWLGPVDSATYNAPEGVPEPGGEYTLELYKYDSCPFCLRVMRVLDATGVEVEMRDTRGDPKAREHLLAETGRTTVPCLFIDGVPLFESADIADWLRVHAVRLED
jgi:glutaredoxin